jgi:hypothetical protein
VTKNVIPIAVATVPARAHLLMNLLKTPAWITMIALMAATLITLAYNFQSAMVFDFS